MPSLTILCLLVASVCGCGDDRTSQAPATSLTSQVLADPDHVPLGGHTRFAVPDFEDDLFVEVTLLAVLDPAAAGESMRAELTARLCRADGTTAGTWWNLKSREQGAPAWAGAVTAGDERVRRIYFSDVEVEPGVPVDFQAITARLHVAPAGDRQVALTAEIEVLMCVR